MSKIDIEVTTSNVLPNNPLEYDVILVTDRNYTLDKYDIFSTGIELYGTNKEIPPGYVTTISTGIKTYVQPPFCFQIHSLPNLISTGLVLLNNSSLIGPSECGEIKLQIANFTHNKVLVHYGQTYGQLSVTTYIPVVQSQLWIPKKVSLLFIKSKAIFESWETLEINRK